MHHIMIVEDEKILSNTLKAWLEKAEFKVTQAFDGLMALNMLAEKTPDLLVLDLNLPIYGGEDILASLRKSSDIPVIILTSKSETNQRIKGFELGADDYVTKPFSSEELVLRIKAMIKRTYGENTLLSIHPQAYVDLNQMVLFINKQAVDLTANEIKVLITLVKEKPRVLSREQIIDQTFGYDYEATTRNIDTYIKNIRSKLETDPKDPKWIKTKYGIGYYFGGD